MNQELKGEIAVLVVKHMLEKNNDLSREAVKERIEVLSEKIGVDKELLTQFAKAIFAQIMEENF